MATGDLVCGVSNCLAALAGGKQAIMGGDAAEELDMLHKNVILKYDLVQRAAMDTCGISKLLVRHPGGKQTVMLFVGKDAIEELDMQHDRNVIQKYGLVLDCRCCCCLGASGRGWSSLALWRRVASPSWPPRVQEELGEAGLGTVAEIAEVKDDYKK